MTLIESCKWILSLIIRSYEAIISLLIYIYPKQIETVAKSSLNINRLLIVKANSKFQTALEFES